MYFLLYVHYVKLVYDLITPPHPLQYAKCLDKTSPISLPGRGLASVKEFFHFLISFFRSRVGRTSGASLEFKSLKKQQFCTAAVYFKFGTTTFVMYLKQGNGDSNLVEKATNNNSSSFVDKH